MRHSTGLICGAILWIMALQGTAALAALAVPAWWPQTLLAMRQACGSAPRDGNARPAWIACRQKFLEKAYADYLAAGPHNPTFAPGDLGIKDDEIIAGVRGTFSAWEGYVDGQIYRVFAGQAPDEDQTGLLYVDWAPHDRGQFLRVPSAGRLTIVAIHGGTLELGATTGKRYAFDLRTRKLIPR